MKTADHYVDEFSFGKDEAELAAIVRRGFEAAGSPSPLVMEAISAEARRTAGHKTFWMSRSTPRLLAAAAAAAAVIAAGGLYHNHTTPVSSHSQSSAGLISQSTPDLAALLLDIQGLNEEGFFMTEEAEPLWL